MNTYLTILVGSLLVNNFVMNKFNRNGNAVRRSLW